MIRFASLGSGSRGNAMVVEKGRTCLLLDCGFSARETERRLGRAWKSPDQLAGVLVTHEHHDHICGTVVFARRHRLPVWMTHGTWRELSPEGTVEGMDIRLISGHEPFAVGDLEVRPYPVPHDAREPAQFLFSDGDRRFGVLTDAGRSTEHIRRQLDRCDALFLESNHDSAMLASGPYPPALKARVAGGLGHLSNDQAAAVLAGVDAGKLQHVVAGHISEKNNLPKLAADALAKALGCEPNWIALAGQEAGLDWREIA